MSVVSAHLRHTWVHHGLKDMIGSGLVRKCNVAELGCCHPPVQIVQLALAGRVERLALEALLVAQCIL